MDIRSTVRCTVVVMTQNTFHMNLKLRFRVHTEKLSTHTVNHSGQCIRKIADITGILIL